MTPHALGALELARLTGRLIDETWVCAEALRDGRRVAIWSTPDLVPASLVDVAPAELPAARAIRVESRGGTLRLNTSWPLTLDVHWLREIRPGFPLGLRPVRVDAGVPVKAGFRLSGEFRSVVWRESDGRSRLNIYHEPAGCEVRAECAAAAEGFDHISRALTGTTSVEWLRGVFADSCSLRWRDLAERIGARTDHLDDLALYFRGLTTSEEHALWEAATSMQSLAELGLWAAALGPAAPPEAFAELLRQELARHGQTFRDSVAGRWLLALSNSSLAGLPEAGAAERLAVAASRLSSLFKRGDLSRLLVRLRLEAATEWRVLAPWYRGRIAETCGKLSADAGPANVFESVNPWMKRLRARLCREAAAAACRLAEAEIPAWIDGGGGAETALAEIAFAPGALGNAALEHALDLDLQPCLEAGSGALLLGGRALSAHARNVRVELLLPFLGKRAWHLERERLAEAEIQATAGRLSLVHPAVVEPGAAPRETASLLFSAVFVARSEAPADDMIHLSFEDRRSVGREQPNRAWLRLLEAYGLPAPLLPPEPCQATFTVQAPWHWAEAWGQMPLQRDADYLEKFTRLSLALQEMGRYWLPALYLADGERYDAPNAVWPLLVYAASQPFVDRKRSQYGYDPMSPYSVQRAAATALAQLPALLAPIHRGLRSAGRAHAAEHYAPGRARHIVAVVQRHPRRLASLLAGDAFFLEHCFHVASLARELRSLARRNPAQALRKLSQFTADIVKASNRGLKRLYGDACYRGLGSLYLLEATRVLAGSSPQHGLKVSLTLETASGVQRLQAAA
jgi:hypothetical protein